MGFIDHLIERIAPQFHWRRHCPATVSAVAEHFVRVELPPTAYIYVNEHLTDNTDPSTCSSATIDVMRRISVIYGVATRSLHPSGEPGKPGWNRALLRNCKAIDPEDAVREVYVEVLWILRNKRATHDMHGG